MTLEAFVVRAHPELPASGVAAVLALVADGFAPAFVARHRREATGGLDDAQVLAVLEAKERYELLRERQRFLLEEIARQTAPSPELRATIEATFDREALDDLYLRYKRKRRTPAVAALEAGLGPLADWIWNCGHGLDTPHPGQTLELWAFTFRDEAHGIADVAAAIAGAEDVLVERLAETAALRARVRERLLADGALAVSRGARAKEGGRFAALVDTCEPVASLLVAHGRERYCAIRRGVNEGEVVMRLGGPPDDPDFVDRLRALVATEACTAADSPGAEALARAARRAFEEHLWPAAEAAVHKVLRTAADDVALAEVAAGMRALLLAAPFGARAVLGIDPAPRGGSKFAVVDGDGRPLEHGVVHFDGDERRAKSAELFAELATRHGVEAVAVGDGIASKDTLRVVRAGLRERGVFVPAVVVSGMGLAAWAASEAAREELPELDKGARAAAGIARRLQDPLAELVKAEPRTLAGGPYVHDVSQPRLERVAASVVTACVADVGVDANRAGAALLARVPGLSPGLAHAIVEHRAAHGPFASRAELRAVALLDARAVEQAVAFLRVGGDHAVHDPRAVLAPVAFDPAVRTLADLRPGLVVPGVVTNVTTFGAFVDIGLVQDGLVHVSRLADEFVKDPHAVVRVGDRVEVRIVDVHREKQQIALSMRREPAQKAPPARAPAPPRRERGGKPRPPERPAFNNPFAALASQLRGTPTGRSK